MAYYEWYHKIPGIEKIPFTNFEAGKTAYLSDKAQKLINKAAAKEELNTAKAILDKHSFVGKLKGGLKGAGIIGLIAAGAVALPFITSSFRKKRTFNEADAPDPEMAQPLPPVMDYTPAAPAPDTMMGQLPTAGDMAMKVRPDGPVNPLSAAQGKETGAPALGV